MNPTLKVNQVNLKKYFKNKTFTTVVVTVFLICCFQIIMKNRSSCL